MGDRTENQENRTEQRSERLKKHAVLMRLTLVSYQMSPESLENYLSVAAGTPLFCFSSFLNFNRIQAVKLEALSAAQDG